MSVKDAVPKLNPSSSPLENSHWIAKPGSCRWSSSAPGQKRSQNCLTI